MGLTQRVDQRRRYRGVAVAPARNDDGARCGEQFQAAIGQHLNPAHGAHRAFIDRGNHVFVPREVELWPGQAEDLDGNAELECAEAIVGQNGNQIGLSGHLAEISRSVSCAPL